MSINRVWIWSGRLAALVAAVVIPACGSTGSPGGSNPNGILWNSQGTNGGAQGLPTSYWNNPNSGVVGPIGISNIITSTDDATYTSYTPSGVNGIGSSGTVSYLAFNDPNAQHPLSTDTGSVGITSRESQLQGQINGYRQLKLGNVGGGGINGGIAVGNVQGIILAGHFKATKSARAHCKHYALKHGGFPEGFNFEGDAVQTTLPGSPADNPGTPPLDPLITPPMAQQGRLGKIEVLALVPLAFAPKAGIYDGGGNIVYSGGGYGEPNTVFARLVIDVPAVITAIGWTNFAVGHWRGGPNFYYWNIIFLEDPIPPN